MMWCILSLAHDDDLRDGRVRQVANDPWLRFFRFPGCQYSLEDQDVVIAWQRFIFRRQWLVLGL